ncbi:small hypothetical protein [Patulibacter medicamentivorans]|uniref:MbtH-like domain-containing protein n=1 Tax=Patulibacter medicamentivorans TaxID=1097667 RepID=H0E2J6_9ACTN|nr:MbtH family protein [Patulibacter medicamentivorans]EHN12106.1 small hypothetical protein [Patulibacter medicamentivorans]
MTNPFDDADGTFSVLINAEGQHSLWPTFAAVPDGWTVALRGVPREQALAHVEAEWTDMRPRSLAAAIERASAS